MMISLTLLILGVSACKKIPESEPVIMGDVTQSARMPDCLTIKPVKDKLGPNAKRYQVHGPKIDFVISNHPASLIKIDCKIANILTSYKNDTDIVVDIHFMEREFLLDTFSSCIGRLEFGSNFIPSDIPDDYRSEYLIPPFLHNVLDSKTNRAIDSKCLKYIYSATKFDISEWDNFDKKNQIKFYGPKHKDGYDTIVGNKVKFFLSEELSSDTELIHPLGIFDTSSNIVVICGVFFPVEGISKSELMENPTDIIKSCLAQIY